jgi:site-specific recombinase XerD
MTEPRRRGRPRSTGNRECGRCHNLVPKIRTHWPEGPICGACFTAAARTYGLCAFCGADRLLPGRSLTGQAICRDCAGITTNLQCDNCGREAERIRAGQCARCVVRQDLEQVLKPHSPPDMRIKRLVNELAAVPRPESIITWMRNPVTVALLTKLGTRELQLSHDAFDALPPSRSLEHLREMLVEHRMMPTRGDRRLARFETWLNQRLQTLESTPAIHTPIEQFARWHHLRRLRENTDPTRNMANATSCAKQEITEAGKFLRWLLDQHNTTINDLQQAQIDAYLSEGTTTRSTIRNFIQWRTRAGIAPAFKTRYRTPRITPLTSSRQRLELIKTVAEADHVALSTRIAALILLLYGTPVSKISELTLDDINTTPARTTIKIGDTPAPIPEALLPLFHQHLAQRGNHRTMNHHSTWLFPGTNAGQHISAQSLMHRLRSLGLDIQAARNAALHDLTKEIDPASLADLLGYSTTVMNIHAARAAVPMATYPAIRTPRALRD